MLTNKFSYLKYGEPKPLQNIPIQQKEGRNSRTPPKKFTPLIELLYNILKKLMDH